MEHIPTAAAPSATTVAPESVEQARSPVRSPGRTALIAATIGTTIEWYDFYLYSTASALVLGPLFFPQRSPAAATLASFATYAAGFVARPIGGAVIGHFGDRVGRKSMLVLTLLVMGMATVLVGVLPTYAQAGIWAPILLVLLRVAQGVGIGGEWGGGVLMATEHAPAHRRAFFSSFPAAGFPLGLAASTAMFSLVVLLPEDDLLTWGWRLPFLLSAVLVAVGIAVRLGVAETPEFLRARRAGGLVRVPIAEVVRQRRTDVLKGAAAALGLAMVVSIFSVYLIAYASTAPVPRAQVLHGLVAGALAEAVMLPVFGRLADRLGCAPVILFGYAVCAVVVIPAVHWTTSGSGWLAAFAFVLAMGVGHAAVYGGIAAHLVAMFPARHRYSALAVTYQLGATIASFGPLLAAALGGARHTATPGVVILLVSLALAAAAVAATRRRGPEA
ncbi:MFS transporter [Mangrovihabitans endophyticus]|uniref:MFS transporter n=1 Tax=Mangrovihabitans endophyticus TaxID=1751298 RepID=UPI001E5125E7|nr:MFS transporter [Mangrovihabitans endophyticus]